jgi:multiple sugar transport system substrate-binding protein
VFLTPRIQREWYLAGATPADNTILQSAAFKAAQPWNPQTSQVFSIVKDFWNMPEYSSMLLVLNNNINASMTGQLSAKAALDLIAKKQAAILSATGRYSAYQ